MRKPWLIALSRAGLIGTTLFLSACGQASPTGSTTGSHSEASPGSPDVQVIRAAALIADPGNDFIHSERITAATVLPEGGFFAVTNVRGGSSFAYKISKVGAVLWRKQLPKGTLATAAGTSTDGSYWIAGNLSEVVDQKITYGSVDFSERIETDGTIAPPVVLSAKNKGRGFYCAVKSEGNYVQSDSDSTRDDFLHLTVQRVSMTDGTGSLLWEQFLPFDQGRRTIRDTSTFSNPNDQLFDCAGISIAGGRIFAAARILVFPDFKTDEEVFQEMTRNNARHLRTATLLIALDLKGKIVASVRHDNTAAGLLVPSPTGPLLFETAQTRNSDGFVNAVGQRLSLHMFDADLKEQKPPVVFADSNFDRVTAAYRTPEGGVLINVCSGDNNGGPEYLRYVSATGAISPKRSFKELGQVCGDLIHFSPSTQPGEVLLLVQTPQQGNELLTVRYSQ